MRRTGKSVSEPLIGNAAIHGGNSYCVWPLIVIWCARGLKARRCVDPQDAGDLLAFVVIAMRQRGWKKRGVACAQRIDRAIDLESDLAGNDKAEFLADMMDQAIASSAGREVENMGL